MQGNDCGIGILMPPCHCICEPLKQIQAVLGTWAGLGVVLDGKDGAVFHPQAAVRSIEQGHMGFHHAPGQGLGVNRKAMVHGCDLNLSRLHVLDGMICAMVAVVHLYGLRAQGQGEHLVAKAYPKDRHIGPIQNPLYHRHRIAARGGWITRAIGQEHPVRGMGQNLIRCGRCGQNCDIAPGGGQTPQNVALCPIIHGNHFVLWHGLGGKPLWPRPTAYRAMYRTGRK